MNPKLDLLQPYPFEKLAALRAGISPPEQIHIALSIGEPKHPAPDFVKDTLAHSLDDLGLYPATKGLPELRAAIADWLCFRFGLSPQDMNPESHILPVNGTREALFAFAQTVIDTNKTTNPIVVMPNPFYQIYEGAALLAGAKPFFLDCTEENNFIPDYDAVPEYIWQQCQLLYICSPGNPTGAITDLDTLKKLISLAQKYNFIIASDECYSELYQDERIPPSGLLTACRETGNNDYTNCVVFHSLSKRSNLPGLRSGFVAGDNNIMKRFLLYRTYHGCAMPVTHQLASIAAWSDEMHVHTNRTLYKQKFDAVLTELDGCLDVKKPTAGFYLWPKTPIDDQVFARELFARENVSVLPGSYLSRDNAGSIPGQNRIRMALVATQEECLEAAKRIKRVVKAL